MNFRTLCQGLLAAIVPAVLLSACSSVPKLDEVVKDRSVEYQSSSSLPPLEVPPDLTQNTVGDTMVVPESGSTSYSDYAANQQPGGRSKTAGVLINPEGITLQRDGDKRWLRMEGAPEKYWDKVRSFWLDNGLLLKVEDRSIGVMETDWAENRADIPQGWLRRQLSGLLDTLYSTATRDKYRVRFERSIDGKDTELFLSHRGAEEVADGDSSTLWQARESDPELEAVMLNKLMVYLGVQEDKASRMFAAGKKHRDRARLTQQDNGMATLTVLESFSRAWRRTGLALDRVGFTVEDRDRSRGLYFVRYVDPDKDLEKKGDGWLSSLKFWGGDDGPKAIEYLISLQEVGADTNVTVLDKDGKPYKDDRTAKRILALLHEQLK